MKIRTGEKLVFILAAVFALGSSVSAQQQVLATAPPPADAPGGAAPTIQVEFTNARLLPAHWLIEIHPDGSGSFEADGGVTQAGDGYQVIAGDIRRSLQVSGVFAAQAFAKAREQRLFAVPCESHMKVAFQGTKRLSYAGPEGSGNCEYNYSKIKDIQALGDAFLGVETTLLFGARLEKMLQHDRLGLDEELESLVRAAHEGNALELGAIAPTLTKIAGDEQVLERARRKARLLLTQPRG